MLDQIYLEILKAGILAVRNAAHDGELSYCRAEADHIHNIPSLIGEDNIERHNYYYNAERVDYLKWLNSNGSEEAKQWILKRYLKAWEEMGKILENENKNRKSKARRACDNNSRG